MKRFSFNETCQMFQMTQKNGKPNKEREATYQKLFNIFVILYGTEDKDARVITDPHFYNRYAFAINRRVPQSLADYLVSIEVLSDDYCVLNENSYQRHISLWEEFTELCPYERIDEFNINDFLSFVSEQEESRLIGREIFQDDY